MDLNDIWQQHKVWILGSLASLILFFVADRWIANSFSTAAYVRTLKGARLTIGKEHYTPVQKREAQKRKNELMATREALETKSYFRPGVDFLLEGKSTPDLHYINKTEEVKKATLERMEIANVDYLSEGLGLPAKNPEFREEKQRLLIGLDLISDAMDRLLDASETVTLNNPSADGLRSVLGIKIDGGGRNSLSRARRRPRRTGRNRNAAASLGEEIKVSAKFRCDALTLELFLEALLGNQEKRPLVLSEIKVKDDNSDNSNEALLVNLVLLALLEKR